MLTTYAILNDEQKAFIRQTMKTDRDIYGLKQYDGNCYILQFNDDQISRILTKLWSQGIMPTYSPPKQVENNEVHNDD